MTMQTASPRSLTFRKSSYSSTAQECVEIADLSTDGAAVRDTRHRDAGHLTFPAPEWATLLGAARRGL